ncbi:hypothetical protein FH972_018999 [Carpinus fangiana]|uniref:Uncharacterized protein n=1 Tax=Carpinus fangiana TaxID=176857 RepID=A0A5N6RQZ7_9ROSI|nr:hypothetical protein FH972_018999 [Carpinus fangiana]
MKLAGLKSIENAHDDSVWAATWVPATKTRSALLLTRSLDETGGLWSSDELVLERTNTGHCMGVALAAAHLSGHIAASASLDSFVRVFDIDTNATIATLEAPPSEVWQLRKKTLLKGMWEREIGEEEGERDAGEKKKIREEPLFGTTSSSAAPTSGSPLFGMTSSTVATSGFGSTLFGTTASSAASTTPAFPFASSSAPSSTTPSPFSASSTAGFSFSNPSTFSKPMTPSTAVSSSSITTMTTTTSFAFSFVPPSSSASQPSFGFTASSARMGESLAGGERKKMEVRKRKN